MRKLLSNWKKSRLNSRPLALATLFLQNISEHIGAHHVEHHPQISTTCTEQMEEEVHNPKTLPMSLSGNHKHWDGLMTPQSTGGLTTLHQVIQPRFWVTLTETVLTVITTLQEDNLTTVITRTVETPSMETHTP